MRIAIMLTSLGVGGAEKQALAVAERMEKRGHTVTVMVLRPRVAEEWLTSLEIVHLEIRKSPLSFLAALVPARRILLEFKPDVVHSHTFHANIFVRLLKLSGVKFSAISTIHNVYEGGWLRMLAYRLTDGLSRRTVAVSEAAARRFIQLKAVPDKKCRVVPNGIDVDEFAPSPERRARMRAALKVEDNFVWIAVGRIVSAKDYPNLVRAFNLVAAAEPHSQLWIAGEMAVGKSARINNVAAGAMSQEVARRVRWLGLRRDVSDLLDAADGFVLSSAWEGMPLALGEAMAMEKPIVATDAGGVTEMVGNVGTIVPAENHEALANAMIATMRKSREERGETGRAARERIRQCFNIENTIDAWENLYRELRR